MHCEYQICQLQSFFIGFASGISLVIAPIYLGEMVTLTLRGATCAMTHFALAIGAFASYLLAFPFFQ